MERGGRRVDTDAYNRDKKDRPLDCWREVEAFKAEVSKLEQVSSSTHEPPVLPLSRCRVFQADEMYRHSSSPCNRCI